MSVAPMHRRPLLLAASLLCVRAAHGQLPGLPVFQGAFAGPGLAAGVNVGRGDARTLIAGAVGYGSRSGRVGLAAGLGGFGANASGYRSSRLSYGGRFAITAIRFAHERL